jgi:hypothetical protein
MVRARQWVRSPHRALLSKVRLKARRGVKTCTQCKESLPLNAFNKNRSRKDGLATMCRECWKVYYKENYYLRGKERDRLRLRNRVQKDDVRAFVLEAKRVPCMDCGETYPPYVMDFDHRGEDPKTFNISHGVYSQSLKAVKVEIAKCDIVCANCHRERTFQRANPELL